MTSGASERYLSKFVLAKYTILKNFYLAAGGFFTIFFGIALVMCFTDKELREGGGLGICIFFVALGIFILYRGFLLSARIVEAKQYSVVFDYDQDGIITLQEIVSHTGKPEEQVKKELNTLFRNNVFAGCHFQRTNPTCVILAGAAAQDSDKSRDRKPAFEAVTCPHCMAVVRIRRGSTGICEYCGSTVSAHNTDK